MVEDFDTVLDLTLCDDAIDYFDFSECLADLVKTEHLTLSEDGLYAITEKGLRAAKLIDEVFETLDHGMYRGFSGEELERISLLYRRMIDNLEAIGSGKPEE